MSRPIGSPCCARPARGAVPCVQPSMVMLAAVIAFAASGAPLGILAHAPAAHAAEGPKAPPTTPSLALLRKDLASGDQVRVERALDALGTRKHPSSRELLTTFIRAGQPDALADRAIAALGALATL